MAPPNPMKPIQQSIPGGARFVGVESYRLYDGLVNPDRPSLRPLGRCVKGARYAVRDGSEVTFWGSLSDAANYHAVATNFAGDIVRLRWTTKAPRHGSLTAIAVIEQRAYVDWGAYGWQ